ncbi:MAG: hypothetical protein QNJ40_15320 [Xanthomonadales bacterium]|nr:hypothetical protein [Xanthomonadales bacterium]
MNIIYWGQTEREECTDITEPNEAELAFSPELQLQHYNDQPVSAERERFLRQFMADRLCSGL